MLTYVPVMIFIILLAIVVGLGYADRRKHRPLSSMPPLSFIIPCYNDAATVDQTVASIFAVYGDEADLVVIDDGSSDGSREKLAALAKRHDFTLILNPSNQGKSKTLNDHFHLAKNDIVVFVDADMIVSRKPLVDAIARLQDPRVGAVSCPYRAANQGFIPPHADDRIQHARLHPGGLQHLLGHRPVGRLHRHPAQGLPECRRLFAQRHHRGQGPGL